MIFLIYKITNKKIGKCYIGATNNFKRRKTQHKKRFNPKDYTFKILAEYNSPDELYEAEKYWIWHYNSYKEGYNKTRGGIGRHIDYKSYRTYGFKLDEEIARKIEDIKEKTGKTYKEIFIEALNKSLNDDLIEEFLKDIKHEEIKISQLDVPLMESTYNMLLEGKITTELLPQIFNKLINGMKSVIESNYLLNKKWEEMKK